jgi:hypothetical protein
MHRTTNAFSVLQATAVVVGLAIIMWSLGMPSFHFVEAANVTSFSDTLSTSEPIVAADHEITFTTPTGVANTQTITIDFGGNFTGTSTIDADASDIAISTTSAYSVDSDCSGADVSAAFSGDVLTLTMCAGPGLSIPANATTTILIGTNAGGLNQLVNPVVFGGGGSYEINLTAGNGADTGSTRVAIVDVVTVTASVDTYFNFQVAGVGGGNDVNGTTTTGTSTYNTIPFGALEALTASSAAQDLTVITNARNGFTVTVTADGMLESSTGADIDGFVEGSYQTTPTGWVPPTPTLGDEWSYGHWGLTSDDTDVFALNDTYISASTTPVIIFTHDGPIDGTAMGEGTTRVGYIVEISALQEAADDYEATLTYVATPVF